MWTELIFVVGQDEVEAWSDALLECGAVSVQAEDADDGSPDEQAIFGEPGEPAPAPGWTRTRLAAMIGPDVDPRRLIAEAAALCGRPEPTRHALRPVPELDWVRQTQSQFEPIPVGNRLWITPSWHLPDTLRAAGSESPGESSATDSPAATATRGEAGQPLAAGSIAAAGDRVPIVLDPGLAFGTGSHPTTRMCLEWLDANLAPGATVIDYGCGSGILAIAAARLGAGRVVAIDIDPQAVESTRDNAANNRVEVEAREPGGAPPEPADVVVANILANPLRILAPLLASLVRPGGWLVLAGLLDRQAEEIAACYPSVDLRAWRSIDGWTCLAGRARA
ncbi:50S ribosomal protein L11 methyltransferase [Burkholderiaceae bacterium FT117]|uniref:50S ribosomal protein L11 methyltransferase n=1 Tax=Zeimonas sediminis TaxID=2944268 RepID=UPI002342C17A|nr:50S ribosomal protein L11 methyltransferase [Zeimonas sediminis]MCM5570691.1 50S ribosomal protein L11 methyltransferase [Zeimonas sediminis]